jgi:hypothetical protein
MGDVDLCMVRNNKGTRKQEEKEESTSSTENNKRNSRVQPFHSIEKKNLDGKISSIK